MALPVSIRLLRGDMLGMPRLDRTAVQALSALLGLHLFGGRFARVHAAVQQTNAMRFMAPSEHFRYLQDLVAGRPRSLRGRPVRMAPGNTVQGAVLFWGPSQWYEPAFPMPDIASAAGLVLDEWGKRQLPQYRLTCGSHVPYVNFCRVQAILSVDPATQQGGSRVEAALRAS